MNNVIRPNFGKPATDPAPAATPRGHGPMRVFGRAAGYVVGLLREAKPTEGPVLLVVVGPIAGNAVEPVAVLPASPGNEIDAEAIGFAVLRALEIVGAVPGAG